MYSLGILINQYSYIQHFHVMSLYYQSNAGFINYFQGSYSLGGHLQIPWFFSLFACQFNFCTCSWFLVIKIVFLGILYPFHTGNFNSWIFRNLI